MLLFFIFLSTNALQFNLQETNYRHKDTAIDDTDYQITFNINQQSYTFQLSTTNTYTSLYSNNPVTSLECINCPNKIKPYVCHNPICLIEKQKQIITLPNGNKCYLADIVIDFLMPHQQQICLMYDNVNSEIKQNGILGLGKYVDNKDQDFNFIYSQAHHLNQYIPKAKFALLLYPNYPILNIGQIENQNAKLKKYQNQASGTWELQFKMQLTDKIQINDKIRIDLSTQYLWLTSAQITIFLEHLSKKFSLFCSLEHLQIVCACPDSDSINLFPEIKLEFNGLKYIYIYPLNIIYDKHKQNCNLNIYQANDIALLGNAFFKANIGVFDLENNIIELGEFQNEIIESLNMDYMNRIYIILACSILGVICYFILMTILQNVDFLQLQEDQLQREEIKELYVIPINNEGRKFKNY